MIVDYDISKINAVLQDFYNATGINIDLLKADFSYVSFNHRGNESYCQTIRNTDAGQKACLLSDSCLLERCKKSKKPEMHICHAGLVDVAVPILYEDVIIGYIIFGQMKADTDFAAFQDYIEKLGLNAAQMHAYYREISFFDTGKIQSVSNIASMLVKHILLENMLKPAFDESMQKAVAYINEHLEDDLSIYTISQNINVSKSVLYKKFHACFQCTVSEYVNNRRIERSVELLASSDLSIEEIAQKTGFSSTSYYTKMFKKQKGLPPLKYKKSLL